MWHCYLSAAKQWYCGLCEAVTLRLRQPIWMVTEPAVASEAGLLTFLFLLPESQSMSCIVMPNQNYIAPLNNVSWRQHQCDSLTSTLYDVTQCHIVVRNRVNAWFRLILPLGFALRTWPVLGSKEWFLRSLPKRYQRINSIQNNFHFVQMNIDCMQNWCRALKSHVTLFILTSARCKPYCKPHAFAFCSCWKRAYKKNRERMNRMKLVDFRIFWFFFLNIFQVDIVVEISRVSFSILLASNNIIGLSSWRCLLRKAAWKALAATF